jgi:hypothetical protein
VRQVSPGKQRASVQPSERAGRPSFSKEGAGGHGSGQHGSSGHGSDGHGSGGHAEARTYSTAVLGVVLVGGILLGLLFAGVISSFVGGSSGSGSGSGSSKPSTPGAIASQRSENAQSRQRSDSLQADTPEARDVRIMGCGTDARGFASARVLITNGTAQRATYYVRVLFTTAGDGRIVSDDVASVKRLPPGQVAPLQSVNAVDSAPGEQVNCTLGSVSRF